MAQKTDRLVAAEQKVAEAAQEHADAAKKALEAGNASVLANIDLVAARKKLDAAKDEAFTEALIVPRGKSLPPKPPSSPKQDALWLNHWLTKNGVNPKNVCPDCSAKIIGLLKQGYGKINWKEQGRKILCAKCRPKNGWVK
jgi:hypothetical protein